MIRASASISSVGAARDASDLGPEPEQPVDRVGLEPGGLGDAPRGAARSARRARRTCRAARAAAATRLDHRRLADSRSSGEDRDRAREQEVDGLALLVGEMRGQAAVGLLVAASRIGVREGRRTEEVRDLALGLVEVGPVDDRHVFEARPRGWRARADGVRERGLEARLRPRRAGGARGGRGGRVETQTWPSSASSERTWRSPASSRSGWSPPMPRPARRGRRSGTRCRRRGTRGSTGWRAPCGPRRRRARRARAPRAAR